MIMKYKRVLLAENVVRIGIQGMEEFWQRNLLENIHLEHLEGDGRITLMWILGRSIVKMGIVWNWFRIVSSGVFLPQRRRIFVDYVMCEYCTLHIGFCIYFRYVVAGYLSPDGRLIRRRHSSNTKEHRKMLTHFHVPSGIRISYFSAGFEFFNTEFAISCFFSRLVW
jgi:hypothetical protein